MLRRHFLASMTAALAAPLASRAFASPAGARYADNIGIQLWTVRNQLKEDAAATLDAVAAAGYRQVELMDAESQIEIAKMARDRGLGVSSAFVNWQAFATPTAEAQNAILDAAAKLGLTHLVFGYIGKGHREKADQYKAHAEEANRFGERCLKQGMKLCYHNHSFEFGPLEDADTTGWDVFKKEFDPDLCPFELDVFWAAVGGLDPVAELGELHGRVTQVHLKDLKDGVGTIYDNGKVPHEAFQALGEGRLDLAAVLDASAKAGVLQCHVEQDQSPDPLKSIVVSQKWVAEHAG